MDLNHVRLFVEVVDRGTFTAAATALGLPKSSVSRGVATLEAQLGVTLLHRTTRRVTLTDAGRDYADHARNALHELDEAGDRVGSAADEAHGLVRMTAPPDLSGGGMIAQILARFLLAHPRVQLDVVLTGRAVDLVAEGIDLAVRAGRLADSSLIARRVAGSVARLYAAPAYLARRGRPRRIEDLARHDCLLHRASGSSARWTLEGPRGARTVEVRGALSCDELSLLVDGARHGIGIALLPDGAATRAVEEGALVPLLPDWGLGGAALWLVHPPTRHLPRRVAVLRDFLYDELRAQLGDVTPPGGPAPPPGLPDRYPTRAPPAQAGSAILSTWMPTWRDVWGAAVVSDDDASVRARTAHAILSAGSILLAVTLLISIALQPLPLPRHLPYAVMLALHLLALAAVRRGALRLAVIGFASAYLGTMVAEMLGSGGDLAVAGYVLPPVVLLVGLTLGGRAGFATAAASSASVLVVVLLVRDGDVPTPAGTTPIRMWLVATCALVITAFMLHVALRVIRESREKAAADQRARLELEEHLLQARRLEAVGRLAAGVAHDFNNLLTVVFAEASRLVRRDDPRTTSSATSILQAAERGAALTRQLLAFGSRQVREPEALDLSAVVEEVRRLLDKFVGDDVRFEVTLSAGLPPVRADRIELEQILLNLVTNARDAMPTGGTLRLRTGVADAGLRARAPALTASALVFLEVADTGAGMPAAVIARVFEPFFTTKELGKGTGLGLATVHGIVMNAGGAIVVDSAPGQGTTFTVLLPAADVDAAAPLARARTPMPERGDGASIVVVDDDGLVRAAVAAIIVEGGHQVVAARSGAEVLAAAQRWTSPPDLVVMDVLMPDMTGPELAARLRARHPQVRVLFMSGYAEERLSERGVILDDVHFVAKPFERRALLDKIDAVLASPNRGATGRVTLPA